MTKIKIASFLPQPASTKSENAKGGQLKAVSPPDPFTTFAREQIVHARQAGHPAPADAIARQIQLNERVEAIERLKLARCVANAQK